MKQPRPPYRAERREQAKALAKATKQSLREVWPKFRVEATNAKQAKKRIAK